MILLWSEVTSKFEVVSEVWRFAHLFSSCRTSWWIIPQNQINSQAQAWQTILTNITVHFSAVASLYEVFWAVPVVIVIEILIDSLIEYKHYLYCYGYLEYSLNDKPNRLLNNFLKRKYPVVHQDVFVLTVIKSFSGVGQ